ncbi:MAG: D-glycero-beta-D-manno-heptose 1-phosphate adenylyltransferase [Bacteroidales bacterium]|jgi:rfaE bifunctional protein nucleotidyltransferase chain/domain
MKQLEFIHSKIFNFNIEEDKLKFLRKIAFWNFRSYKIVFTNGCFDILHPGHLDYLSRAADMGNVLIVGLNSDSSVKKIKGSSRPINNENDRALILASLSFIKAVVLFEEETPYELIKATNPDILIKGSDYNIDKIIGYDIVKAKGGEIITIDFVEGYSTSLLIEKIKSV